MGQGLGRWNQPPRFAHHRWCPWPPDCARQGLEFTVQGGGVYALANMNQVSVTYIVGAGELLRQAVFFRAAELDAPGFCLGSHNTGERVANA